MRCEEFHLALKEAVETKSPASVAVRQHGTGCSEIACQSAWNDYCLLESVLPVWRGSIPSSGFTDRVLQAVEVGPRVPTPRTDNSPIAGEPPVSRLVGGVGWLAAVVPALAAACLMAAVWMPAGVDSSRKLLTRDAGSDGRVYSVPPELLAGAAMEEVHAVYADWVEGASTRLRKTATLVLLEETPGAEAGTDEQSGWFGGWSKRIEDYEAEIGETFLKFVESTKMDQS